MVLFTSQIPFGALGVLDLSRKIDLEISCHEESIAMDTTPVFETPSGQIHSSPSSINASEEPLDSVVTSVIQQYVQRSMVGKKKYGTTLDREDLTVIDWIQHTQEELMDATLYLEKLKQTLIEKGLDTMVTPRPSWPC